MRIPRGRGLILSGNRQLAAQYVGIAKRRALELQIMLDVSNVKIGQKKYWLFKDCVWCTINIIDGATFIRIHGCSESAKEECSLTWELYDKGSNRLGVDLILNSDTGASSYYVEIDTGAPPDIHGSRVNTRYARVFVSSFFLGQVRQRTIDFATPGLKEISGWAHEFIVAASYANFDVNSTTFSHELVIGDITNATVAIYARMENESECDVDLNGEYVGTLNSTQYGEQIILNAPDLVDPMVFDFSTSGGNDIWFVTLFVYEQTCVPIASGTQVIT